MKARQAAAVAAAKAEPTPAQARKGAIPRPASTSQLGRADADGWGGGGASGKSSKKRSYAAAHHSEGGWDDDEDDEQDENGLYAYGSTSGGRAAGGSSKGASKAARLAADNSRGPSGGSKRSEFAAAPGEEAGGGDSGLGTAGMSSGGPAKKKKRPGVSVARLIGLAAQQAAAEGPPPRFCVVQLQPDRQQGQQDETGTSSAAAEAAGRPEGRSRKQPKAASGKGKAADVRQPLHHLAPGQVATPSIDRPFLACPMACTVAELKKMVLQQLLQQGTTANLKSNFELQLVAGQQQGLLGGSSCGSEGSSDVLQDATTVAQLHEKGGCLGPDVQVQYRLVGA
jgi:hypothetical protein